MQLGGNSVSTNSKFVYVYTSTCTPFAFFGSSLGDHYDHMCNSRAWQKNGLKVKEKGAKEKKRSIHHCMIKFLRRDVRRRFSYTINSKCDDVIVTVME